MSAARGETALGAIEDSVLAAFQDLLAAIKAAETRAVNAAPSATASSDGDAGQGIGAAVRQTLLPAVEQFGRRLDELLPNTGNDPARQAMYAATAFVDERMIALAWSGRREWMDRPLELQFFNSRSGGQDVFRQIDDLGGQGLTDRALASVYLSMLNLGFAGQYDPQRDGRKLAEYRRQLFKFLSGHDPEVETVGRDMTELATPAQQDGQVRYLPYLRPWLMGGAALIVAFLVFGHVIWSVRTADMHEDVSRITEEMGY